MKIKRFTSLIVVLAILTMGGVFAAWNFAGSNAGSGVSGELQFGMENVQYSTSRGTYSVTTNGQKIFTIDQTNIDTGNPNNNDYTAKLVINPTATITIKFTPSKGVSGDIATHGLLSEFFFSFKQGVTQTPYTMDANGNYTTEANPAYSVPIITLDSTKVQIHPKLDNGEQEEADKLYWTDAGDGVSFSYTLDAMAIAKYVALNNEATKDGAGFVLDTIEEYYAFGTCLDGGYTCALVVNDPTDTTTSTQPANPTP